MAQYNVSIHSKVSRLRWKYRSLDSVYFLKFHQVGRAIYNLSFVYPNIDLERDSVDRLYLSLKSKRKRYRFRVRNMLDKFGWLYLVSLTFTDDVLSSTDFDTRKKYVQRWCKQFLLDYFGCVDFGKKNNREHYHIICAIDSPYIIEFFNKRRFFRFDFQNQWTYGFSSVRLIDSSNSSLHKTLNYAFKTVSYAFKSAGDSQFKPFFARGISYSGRYYYINYEFCPVYSSSFDFDSSLDNLF